MLEVVIVYLMARHIGGIVEGKGESGTSYKWMTVGLWFGGEVVGFAIGFALFGRSEFFAAYGVALCCAAGGVAAVWVLANRVPPDLTRMWLPTCATPPAGLPAWAQPDPAQQPVLVIPGNVELMVENRMGDWALIRAGNGWRGFVDARLLVARQPTGSAWAGQPGS